VVERPRRPCCHPALSVGVGGGRKALSSLLPYGFADGCSGGSEAEAGLLRVTAHVALEQRDIGAASGICLIYDVFLIVPHI
jgi:hypothetical protein